jgi:hypothetical protein
MCHGKEAKAKYARESWTGVIYCMCSDACVTDFTLDNLYEKTTFKKHLKENDYRTAMYQVFNIDISSTL